MPAFSKLPFAAFFLSLGLASPVPGFTPIQSRQLSWSQATCTTKEITDASYQPNVRWKAVDTERAWSAVAHSWNHDAPGPGQQFLPFPLKVSNFFHGPEHFDCQDIGEACNAPVQCHDTSFPAGYLILNSFVSIHRVHANRYNGLNAAMNQIQNDIPDFTKTFAPQIKDDSKIIGDILNAFGFMVGLGSAYAWNTVIKTAKIFSNDDYRGVAKDSFNAAVTLAVSVGRNHIPTAGEMSDGLGKAMGTFVGKWMKAEAEILKQTFSGAVGTLGKLHGLIQNGLQGALKVGIDLQTMKEASEKIIYTKLIPAAWENAPGDFLPIIVVSDNACNSKAEGKFAGHMDDSTAAQSHVCYDGKIFYVVTPEWTNNRGILGNWKLNSLPGGTYDNMSGGKWGGVSLDDLVISSWDGYKLNGMKNDYQMPENSAALDGNGGVGNIIFEAGVRTPGFTSMKICDVDTLTKNLKNCNRNYDGFPCRPITTGNTCY